MQVGHDPDVCLQHKRLESCYWQSTQTPQHAQANATRSRDSAYAMLAVMSLPTVARQTGVHIPTPAQLLEGSMGSPLAAAATGRYAHTVRTRAVAWVRAAARQLRQLSSSAPPVTTPASAPERRLNTSLIASSFFDEAQAEGNTVYETTRA